MWVDEIWAPKNWVLRFRALKNLRRFQAPGFGEHRKSFFRKRLLPADSTVCYRKEIKPFVAGLQWLGRVLNKSSQEWTISADADPQRGWLCYGLCFFFVWIFWFGDSWGFAPNRSDGNKNLPNNLLVKKTFWSLEMIKCWNQETPSLEKVEC